MSTTSLLDLAAFDLNEAARRILGRFDALANIETHQDSKEILTNDSTFGAAELLQGGYSLRSRMIFAIGSVISMKIVKDGEESIIPALSVIVAADARWDGPLSERTPDAAPSSLKGAYMNFYTQLNGKSPREAVKNFLGGGHRWSPSLQASRLEANPDPKLLAWVQKNAAKHELTLEKLAHNGSSLLAADALLIRRLKSILTPGVEEPVVRSRLMP